MSVPLVESLENATDEEIVEASNKLANRMTKKFIFGIALSIAVHFASEFLIKVIETQRKDKSITE